MDYLNLFFWTMTICCLFLFFKYRSLAAFIIFYISMSMVYVAFSKYKESPNNQKITINYKSNGEEKNVEIMSKEVLIVKSVTQWVIFIILGFAAYKFSHIGNWILIFICLLSSIMVFYNYFTQGRGFGITLNTSAEGNLLAITAVFMFTLNNYYKLLTLIPLFAVFLTGSSVGIGGFALAISSYFYFEKKRKILPILIVSLIFGLGFYFLKEDFLSDSHRFKAWSWMFSWWFDQSIWTKIFGTGFGTFWAYGPYIQITQKIIPDKELFTFMHNDWLEILFELGFLGFIPVVWIYVKRFFSVLNPIDKASLLTLAAVAFLNMPLRYPASCLTVFLIWFTTKRSIVNGNKS